MQTTQQPTETEARDQEHIIKLLELQGIKPNPRSYITKAAKALPTLTNNFTVPTLAKKAGIPRSKGYPTIKLLEELHLVTRVSKVKRPPDWGEYTRSMRKRFNYEHGLPRRGIEPQRYRYTPVEALLFLRMEINRKIRREDQRALQRINAIRSQYGVVANGLASHQQ